MSFRKTSLTSTLCVLAVLALLYVQHGDAAKSGAASAGKASKGTGGGKSALTFETCLVKLSKGVIDVACIRLVVSKLLSYAIIAGSLILKVPQIIKILAAKDVTGLSPLSFYIDVVMFASTAIYNYLQGNPFSTYGESVFILVQNTVLVLLLWYYSGTSAATSLTLSVLFALSLFGMLNTPSEFQWTLSSAGIPFAIARSVPQIWSNFQLGHTGQLAFITLLLNFAGSLARMFTTMQETQDQILLIGYAVGAVLNGTLVLQVLLYWTATNKATSQKKKKKNE